MKKDPLNLIAIVVASISGIFVLSFIFLPFIGFYYLFTGLIWVDNFDEQPVSQKTELHNSQSTLSDNSVNIDPTGTYVMESDTLKDGKQFGYTGRIQVEQLKNDKIAMSFGIMKGAPSYNSGSFVDTINYASNIAIYKPPTDIDPSCKITFTFSEKDVKVEEETDDYNAGCGFGHAVVADGIFIKKSSEKPELRHYITDEKIK